MDAIARALAVYLFLLVLFRVSGKRTLAEASNFDFVLLLIVAEATQQALLGDDFSVTNSILHHHAVPDRRRRDLVEEPL